MKWQEGRRSVLSSQKHVRYIYSACVSPKAELFRYQLNDLPSHPSFGRSQSGSAVSALIPQTTVVSPNLIRADPFAVDTAPAKYRQMGRVSSAMWPNSLAECKFSPALTPTSLQLSVGLPSGRRSCSKNRERYLRGYSRLNAAASTAGSSCAGADCEGVLVVCATDVIVDTRCLLLGDLGVEFQDAGRRMTDGLIVPTQSSYEVDTNLPRDPALLS
jgi:hypothetical protein